MPSTKETAMTAREIAAATGLVFDTAAYSPVYKALIALGKATYLGTLRRTHAASKQRPGDESKFNMWWFESKRGDENEYNKADI